MEGRGGGRVPRRTDRPYYLDKAETSFRHVLTLDSKDLDALRGLGNVHFDREEYDKAVESYLAISR